jgi:hypothetical protein
MVRIDTSGVKSAEDLAGFDRPLPGRYHVVVRTVDDTFERSKSLVVEFDILAGTTADQTGKVHREYVPVDGKASKRSLKFALAAGLITEGDLASNSLDISFDRAVGRDLIIDLEDREYLKDGETKKTVSATFLGFHKIGSPEAAGVPLGDRPAKQDPPAGSPTATTAASADDTNEWANF